jgi:tripartite-type tricarboxylate transporter receptor subunit TctC
MQDRILRTLLIALASLYAGAVCAQPASTAYPTKPLRMVVPYAPGGATDIIARFITPRMIEAFGQQILVDNRPGGATVIGTEIVARAPADGYTLLMSNIALGANPSLFRKLPFDVARDFAPVSLVASVPTLLVLHPSIPARSVKEFIAYAKTKPAAINYGSAGNGSANHLTTELFKSMAGVDLVHVPYKGGAPAVADLIGGHITMMFASMLSSLQHVKSGKLVAVGISSAARSAQLPDVPTVAEAGVPGFEVTEWQMLLAPAGAPGRVVERLQQEVRRALAQADVKERIAGLGATAIGSTSPEAGAFLKAEVARWARVTREAGIKTVD